MYDGTCVTAVRHDGLRPLASGKRLATDYAEATKRKAKAAACDAKNCDFMTWAASTRGGIGHEAATWFNTNFDIKAAKASSDSERWRVSSERKRFLQVHSTIVARRNAAIFDYNAWPKMWAARCRGRLGCSMSRDGRGRRGADHGRLRVEGSRTTTRRLGRLGRAAPSRTGRAPYPARRRSHSDV